VFEGVGGVEGLDAVHCQGCPSESEGAGFRTDTINLTRGLNGKLPTFRMLAATATSAFPPSTLLVWALLPGTSLVNLLIASPSTHADSPCRTCAIIFPFAGDAGQSATQCRNTFVSLLGNASATHFNKACPTLLPFPKGLYYKFGSPLF
jgi:hypothetical protein